tara:strand:- start:196 stop:447 length:252 start_codon:yes stop_codon:yes gene_type:complete
MNWIDFVRTVAKEKDIKYNEALKIASVLYHKQKGTSPKPKVQKNIEKKLTGKFILRNLKRLIDNGKIYKGQKKRDIIDVLRTA